MHAALPLFEQGRIQFINLRIFVSLVEHTVWWTNARDGVFPISCSTEYARYVWCSIKYEYSTKVAARATGSRRWTRRGSLAGLHLRRHVQSHLRVDCATKQILRVYRSAPFLPDRHR